MSCNPCCCLKLKDAAVTIGIWSTVYALVQIGVFGWQFSVLAQCQHVIMAQSNLQCDYYCPCVGASTARTSAIIEGKFGKKCLKTHLHFLLLLFYPNLIVFFIYSIMQLGIFGWQMAAIKYEKDRAANTLLPNYNTYGRYDIPTYYESYWQSPEERYYTWLFVIQILCLICAFFLLFASIMMIYGVHTWSRYLLMPWMVTMCASILTSLAYCIMWWAGDVRDYWLMLTIVEMFGVFLNIYCFVVIATFHRRMLAELEYYARRRKYDRFSQQREPTIEQALGDSSPEEFGHQQKQLPAPSTLRRLPASQFPYQPSPQPIQQRPPYYEATQPAGMAAPSQFYQQQQQQRTPMERFQQEAVNIPPPPPVEQRRPFSRELQRPQSAMERRFPPSQAYDEFRRHRRPSSSHHHRTKCRHCGRDHARHYRCHHCQHHIDHCHCHHPRHRKYSCSSICSTANFELSADEECFKRKRSRSGRRKKKDRWSDQDQESDFSEIVPSVQSEHNYGNIQQQQRQRPASLRRRQGRQRKDETPPKGADERQRSRTEAGGGTLSRAPSQQFLPQGISIPQQIIIPPTMRSDGTVDPQAERQYRINSEITISYDPLRQQRDGGAPAIPPRKGGQQMTVEPFGSIRRPPAAGHLQQFGTSPMAAGQQQPVSMSTISNV